MSWRLSSTKDAMPRATSRIDGASLHRACIHIVEKHAGGRVAFDHSAFSDEHPDRPNLWRTAYVARPDGTPKHRNMRSMGCPTDESAIISLIQNLRFLPDSPLSTEQKTALTADYVALLFPVSWP